MTQNGIKKYNLNEINLSNTSIPNIDWLFDITMDIWDDQDGEIRRKKKLEERKLKIEKIMNKKC